MVQTETRKLLIHISFNTEEKPNTCHFSNVQKCNLYEKISVKHLRKVLYK